MTRTISVCTAAAVTAWLASQAHVATQSTRAVDPGVRAGSRAAGAPLANLSPQEHEYFAAGKEDFIEAESIGDGIGPRMNLDSCAGCHVQPAVGGSSPAVNPQVAFATQDGGVDSVPPFIGLNGPVREARFIRNPDRTPDGGVHALFTVSGRPGSTGCSIAQPDFAGEHARGNVVFRIPTPLFGVGLIEQITDSAIVANQAANAGLKRALGIGGRPNFHVSGRTITGQTNRNGNDGTIARLGWKAQNKSLLLFSGEAYNVEMGITNELFPTEREEANGCQLAPTPNSVTDMNATTPVGAMSSIEKFSFFMKFLAPPTASPDTPGGAPSIARGRAAFTTVGCALCHSPELTTGEARFAALAHQRVALFSDLLLHDMGIGLADGISQGEAGPREFRTAPLWGMGQRIFFLHDGRASRLETAIAAHQSSGSEANGVIQRFNQLTEAQKQDLFNFLRSL